MSEQPTASILEHFEELEDTRRNNSSHLLGDLLVITICAVVCGADDWVAVERFGNAKKEWLSSFLGLPHGIPSHDTFGRVFAALDAEAFSSCFLSWMGGLAQLGAGEVLAIDGKTLRRSFDRASNKAAIHMVSCWATANRMVIGQVKTEAKSNEITAIPRLLELLDISGCLVTTDAMGCQRAIAKQIVEQSGDYLLQVKGNQGTLHEEMVLFFKSAQEDDFKGIQHDADEQVDGDHGRVEIRRAWSTQDIDWFEDRHKWHALSTFIMIESERHLGEHSSVEQRYYISSLALDDAARFNSAVRAHWGIENGLHWCLDVAFREDDSRIRKGHAPQNMATMRHIALNLLKRENTAKVGIKNKRLIAGWDHDYLLKLLFS